ncbi:putative C2H2 transcription factor [Aspergillus steynii IBT 23096]|uniref:Putative C2H2 transcription factor n=1 Tax=Aspergillus steynii IBT 23096 TaxID=1392250 RepID=A0A2I2GJJ4_9EURO|nr:putative C2H2 transcription factor [Aspergillus steynii IBT 23096]PLB53052.1 putative C2H2 transcription factor [Aspergillus steynii IBT 23096]
MSSFLPVNTISSPPDRMMEDATTPTTPRPSDAQNPPRPTDATKDENTPRNVNSIEPTSRLSDSHSVPSPSEDPSHADSDGDREGSDAESDHKGNAPPSKKKKGQRFYCTDYPPCNLSFTRSEHLARHIRKHTGERPFQCHCSRRFSRLDNLRQHAQTVHVNEEIPGDSLAATGTRFQRQIRTDRVRPPGRARAGTAGSQGTHSRGHSRNLSASSITSTASTYSQPQEFRRRPPPLIMANDGRARLAMDTMADPPSTPPGQVRGIPGPAATGSPYASSHIFSAGGSGSPHVPSPMSTASHASGFWEGKTAARRLSVPTGGNPFASQPVNAYPPHGYPGPASTAAYPPPSGGVYASPVSSNYPMSRDEAAHGAADADLRRRTWHPSTYSAIHRPATSGLSSYQTPDSFHPSFGSHAGGDQPPRLPGIESFDKVVSQRPLTPPVRRPSPMQLDQPGKPSPNYTFGGGFNYSQPSVRPAPPISGPGHRRGHVSWDMSLHTNLTGLHIRDKPPQPSKDASHWSQQTIAELHSVGARPSSSYQQNVQEYRSHGGHHPSYSNATTSSQATRTSPEDSSSSEGVHTPSTASLEYHPAIVHNSGYIEAHHPPFSSDTSQAAPQSDGYQGKPDPRSDLFHHSSGRESGMGRLEALVAVATSENKGTAKLFA